MRARYTRPYVDALFAVAGSPEAVEALLPKLETIAATFRRSGELRAVLQNPGIERGKKNAILLALTARERLDGLGGRLLLSLLANRRLLALGEVLAAARERLDKERNVVEATVTSAAPLDGTATGSIRTALESKSGKNVRLKSGVDARLLGGFVVRMGSEVYDASLASRLERARRALHTADSGAAETR